LGADSRVTDRDIAEIENPVDFQPPIQSPCLIFSGIATAVKQNPETSNNLKAIAKNPL
jgi:hypothetical protein